MSRGGAGARAAALTLGVIALDQLTKAAARGSIGRGEREPVFFGIALVNVRNRGIAFGLFSDGGALLVALAAAAVVALLVFFALNATRRGAWVPVGLLLGGAAGNLIDRAREGAVTDFVDLPLWPAFNLADVAIVAGVVALLWVMEGPGRGADPDPA
jgi:signal peptidase II